MVPLSSSPVLPLLSDSRSSLHSHFFLVIVRLEITSRGQNWQELEEVVLPRVQHFGTTWQLTKISPSSGLLFQTRSTSTAKPWQIPSKSACSSQTSTTFSSDNGASQDVSKTYSKHSTKLIPRRLESTTYKIGGRRLRSCSSVTSVESYSCQVLISNSSFGSCLWYLSI